MVLNKKHIGTLLPLLVFAFIGKVYALDVSTKIIQNRLSTTLQNISYPARFIDKELDSGLPNTVTVLMSLSKQQHKLHVVNLSYQITYDLWDEVYAVKTTSALGQTNTQVFDSKQALTGFLHNIKIDAVETSQLQPGSYKLRALVVVNPVETERIKKIQAWIASSNGFTVKADQGRQKTSLMRTSVRVASQGENPSTTVTPSVTGVSSSGPRFQKLFDQILSQYMKAGEVPALWRSEQAIIDVNLTHEN